MPATSKPGRYYLAAENLRDRGDTQAVFLTRVDDTFVLSASAAELWVQSMSPRDDKIHIMLDGKYLGAEDSGSTNGTARDKSRLHLRLQSEPFIWDFELLTDTPHTNPGFGVHIKKADKSSGEWYLTYETRKGGSPEGPRKVFLVPAPENRNKAKRWTLDPA